jgi:hypothetical protein
MNVGELAQQIVANYTKHGWTLRRVLLRPTAEPERRQIAQTFPASTLIDAEVDALWFARASHADREAWELRLIAEQPYALFETSKPMRLRKIAKISGGRWKTRCVTTRAAS